MPHEASGFRKAPKVVSADIDLGPGIQLAHDGKSRHFDDVLECAARADWAVNRATPDRQARGAFGRPGREEKRCCRSDVWTDDFGGPEGSFLGSDAPGTHRHA